MADLNVKNYWTPCIAIYYSGTGTVAITQQSSTVLRVTDGTVTSDITFTNRDITDIISDINRVQGFTAKTLVNVGKERITADSLFIDTSDRHENGAYLIRYKGHILKSKETNVIQLKTPHSVSRFEPWYARVGRGKFRARFGNVSYDAYPGINPNTIYTFSTPEYMDQAWSLIYGPPYKDVIGEIPQSIKYSSKVSASVLRVARGPIYWKNNNISIRIKGSRQSPNIIKYVDENNRLIYLNQKIDNNIPTTVDYSYRELDYIYDSIDLNASIANNPVLVDTYVAFYLKPTASDGALISGGNGIFHEVLNTEVAGRVKVARLIPETAKTESPQYEPVIYLGSINIRQAHDHDDIEVIDTRTRGGGLYAESVEEFSRSWRETNYFFDIGSLDGLEIPGNSAIVIKVPSSVRTRGMSKQEIEQRVSKNVALGIVPIVEEDS